MIPDGAVLVPDHATVFGPEEGEWGFGSTLASGSDIDQNGIAEWATSAPQTPGYANDQAAVRVFEHDDAIAVRRGVDPFHESLGRGLAAGDVDGDGWADLLYSSDAWPTFEGRVHVVRSVDRDEDVHWALEPDPEYGFSLYPSHIDVSADGLPIVTWWNTGASAVSFRVGPLTPSTIADPHVLAWADYVSAAARNDSGPYEGSAVYLSSSTATGDGATWFGGLQAVVLDAGRAYGRTFRCPMEVGLVFPTDCTLFGEEDPDVGFRQSAADVDGDGIAELVTSEPRPHPAHGGVTIFRQDGTLLATIRGTKEAQLGSSHHGLVDDQGDPWLLVSQTNLIGAQPGTVYAFRGEDLVGDLTEADAARVFVDPEKRTLGHAIESYRATPDDPLMLLLSNPYDEGGVVYMLPFDLP